MALYQEIKKFLTELALKSK